MKKSYLEWVIPGLVLIVLMGLIIYSQSKEKALGGWIDAYVKTSTNYSTTIGMAQPLALVASSTQILAANSERAYARCQNRNTNGFEISVMLGSTATTSSVGGIILVPMASTTPQPSFFEINLDNPFTGAVYAYAQATSSVVCVEN